MGSPAADLINTVAGGVAYVEGLDGAVGEVRDETVEWRSYDERAAFLEKSPELRVAHEEGVEEPADP